MPNACTEQTSSDNQAIAMRRNPVVNCAPMMVSVLASDAATGLIAIRVLRDDNGASGDIRGLRWGDEANMWAACPSTLTGVTDPDNVGPVPAPETVGILYLSEALLRTSNLVGTPKWPTKLPLPPPRTAPLRVAPTSLVLTGTPLMDDGDEHASGTVDLWDPNLAAQDKPIEVDERGVVTVYLTERGFQQLHAEFPAYLFADEAAEVIAKSSSAREIARAWQIVAACVEQIESKSVPEEAQPKAIESVRKALPSFGRNNR